MKKTEGVATPRQGKDVISKILAGMYKDKSFAVYGVDLPKIKHAEASELPVIMADDRLSDLIFRLEDNSLLITDYESALRPQNMHKYAAYVTRVAQKFDPKASGIRIRMLVIYTCEISEAPARYDMGAMTLDVEQAFVTHINGKEELERIAAKVARKERLTDEDQMISIILPLTVKEKDRKKRKMQMIDLVNRVLDMATELKKYDEKAAVFIVSGMTVAANSFITEEQLERAKGVIRMTKFSKLFEDDRKKAANDADMKARTETVDRMLADGILTNEQIAKYAGVTPDFVLERAGMKNA